MSSIATANCADADYFVVYVGWDKPPLRVEANHYEVFSNGYLLLNNKINMRKDNMGYVQWDAVKFVQGFAHGQWSSVEVVRSEEDT